MAYLEKGAEPPLKGKGSKLGFKMRTFVDEYMVDMNAKAAVLRAGYKTKNPDIMAMQLMSHPLIQRELEARMLERRKKTELSAQYVINKLVDIVENTESNNPQAALRGLELLGKTMALFKERQEISGPDGNAIEMEQRVKEDVADLNSKLASLAKRAGADGVVGFPKRSGES